MGLCWDWIGLGLCWECIVLDWDCVRMGLLWDWDVKRIKLHSQYQLTHALDGHTRPRYAIQGPANCFMNNRANNCRQEKGAFGSWEHFYPALSPPLLITSFAIVTPALNQGTFSADFAGQLEGFEGQWTLIMISPALLISICIAPQNHLKSTFIVTNPKLSFAALANEQKPHWSERIRMNKIPQISFFVNLTWKNLQMVSLLTLWWPPC